MIVSLNKIECFILSLLSLNCLWQTIGTFSTIIKTWPLLASTYNTLIKIYSAVGVAGDLFLL